MHPQVFTKKTPINASAEALFDWHEREGAFLRLNPPWEKVKVISHVGGIQDGAQVDLQIGLLGPIKQRWLLEHRDYVHGRQFKDVQIKGTFADYMHEHLMHPSGDHTSTLEDRITYSLPFGPLGKIFGGWFVRNKFERMFAYRHAVTANDIRLHQRYQDQPRLNVAITGSSGMIGTALRSFLTTGGHTVTRILRDTSHGQPDATWNPNAGTLDVSQLAGVDAVVHLAGENIADGRWTDERKRKIMQSRVQGTRLLAESLAKMDNPPKVLISASAIGYYGNQGDKLLHEDDSAGNDFLATVCREWEDALQPAVDAGIRVITLRFGIILTLAGGVLAKLHLPFQLGAGGKIGNGQQYMSWIAIDDLIGIIYHGLLTPSMVGTYNAVAPHPQRNKDFAKIMGRVMHRPSIAPLPVPAVKIAFGELGDALLLASQRVAADKICAEGYSFLYPELEGALRHALGKV